MHQPSVDLLMQRLERLERDNRRFKRAGAVFGLGALAVVLMGQATVQDRVSANMVVARTIEAQSILLRDATGKVRALLESQPTGPVTLTLSDKDGRERLALGVGPAGGVGVVFRDKEGTVRAGMGVGPAGRPYLVPKRLTVARQDESP
jgi:hypothetical protein